MDSTVVIENIHCLEECPICFSKIKKGIVMSCCKNIICKKCYKEWDSSCVFCRNEVISHKSLNISFEKKDEEDNIHDMCYKYATLVCVIFYVFFIFFAYIYYILNFKPSGKLLPKHSL
tara:strand:- start:71 stop:424 length:354 start_codon:yes stop_codon:yes gene_type:complete